MAARIDGVGGSLTRTAGMPSITAFTHCGWAYIVADQVGYLTALNNTSPNADTIAGIVLNGANTFEVWSATGGGVTFAQGAAASGPAQGVWFFWWKQCSGSGSNLLKAGWALRGATSFTVAQTTLTATPTVTSMGLGIETYADPTNVRFQDVKTWDAVLSTDELLSQMHRMVPVRWANLSGWYPMLANSVTNIGIDFSGNGRNLTTVATVTVEDPPPLTWGASSVVNSGPLATGTTFNQSAQASTSPVASRGLQTGKPLLAATTPTKSLQRAVTKALQASTTPPASLTKQTTRTLLGSTSPVALLAAAKVRVVTALASTAPVAALAKIIGKPIPASTAPVAAVQRATSKTLQASTTPAKAFAALKVLLKSIQATTSPVGSLKRQTGKVVSASTSPLAAVVRAIAKALRVSTSPVATKGAGRALILRVSTSPFASAVASFVFKLRGRTVATTISATGSASGQTISGLTGQNRGKTLP